MLLYTRTSLESVQDLALLPRSLPYAVGEPTQRFLDEHSRAAERSAAIADRVSKNREAALVRRAAKKARVDAGSTADLQVLDP